MAAPYTGPPKPALHAPGTVRRPRGIGRRRPGRAPEPCRRLAGDRDSRPVTMAGESRGGGRGPGGASLAPDRPAEDGQAVW